MAENSSRRGNSGIRHFRSRPELGSGPSFDLQDSRTDASFGEAAQQRMDVDVLLQDDGLPRYSIFTGPTLSRRRRPRGQSTKKRQNREVLSWNNFEDMPVETPEPTTTTIVESCDDEEDAEAIDIIDEEVPAEYVDQMQQQNERDIVQSVIGGIEESYMFQLLYAKSILFVAGKTDILVKDFDCERHMLKVSFILKNNVFLLNIASGCPIAEQAVDVDHFYTKEVPTIVELPFSNDSLLCIRPPDLNFAVVGIDRRGFMCTFCEIANRSCPHVKSLKLYLEDEPDIVPDFVTNAVNAVEVLRTSFPRTYICSSISEKSIPETVLQSQLSIFNGLLGSTIEQVDEGMRLFPEDNNNMCLICGSECEEQTFWSVDSKKIFTLKNIFEVNVTEFRQRVFIKDKRLRDRLRKFSKLRQLDTSDRNELNELLTASSPILKQVLMDFEELYGSSTQIHDEIWTLFRCISSVSPTCSYFPPSAPLDLLLQRLSAGLVIRKDPEALAQLQSLAPIIFGVLKVLPPFPVSLTIMQLFNDLNATAKLCFSVEQHTLSPVDGDDLSNYMSFFPCWPTRFQRGVYLKDKGKSGRAEDCTKLYRGHPNLLPGIFTVYCEHGKSTNGYLYPSEFL
eukprot:gene3976-4525_t